MRFHSIAITGGAGFVGANLAILFRRAFSDLQIVAVDSLKRRGSELNLPRLREAGVAFVHGDVRCEEDLQGLPEFDLLLDCAAEPSVHAGASGTPRYVLNTNLQGTINCLEAARLRGAAFLLLSSSRIYPMQTLNALPFHETETRFRWGDSSEIPGFSRYGVAEHFPLEGARSFYGTSKLAGELLVHEYVYNTDMPALINRCGVLAGPWQMGKVDQGVVTLWVARHFWGLPLNYIGYGGTGKQVRDVLHIEDLFDLLVKQMSSTTGWEGGVYNVGGGMDVSTSLQELTLHCQEAVGRKTNIRAVPETSDLDLRIYVTDSQRVTDDFEWKPRRSVRRIVDDIHAWLREYHETLGPLFVP